VPHPQATTTEAPAAQPLALTITLPADEFEALALRIAELLHERHDDGFLDVDGAAAFLDLSRKAIYRLVERHQLPHHRAGGRLLFDRRELRAWVEAGS
jgi:excisionase family DNA binding protein